MQKKSKYNMAVVGVGAVGIEMLRCLRGRNFPIGDLRVFARSARDIQVDGQNYSVFAISPEGFDGIDIALFAGTEGEKGAAVTYAIEAVKRGAVVIDNGADFRMDPKVPLVVPEVNAKDLDLIRNWLLEKKHRPEGRGLASDKPEGDGLASYGQSHSQSHKGIIANPNCSTIQMVVAIHPIYEAVGIKRIIACSYQAVSGAGRSGIEQLEGEIKEYLKLKRKQPLLAAFAYRISKNVIPQIGNFGQDSYTSEEWKMVHETHKIMHDKNIKISATCVRVPVETGHSEAIYLETRKHITAEKVRRLLAKNPGIKIFDSTKEGIYPVPSLAEGKDEVFVGRIRRDPFVKNGLWLWVVSDNLRKGAALNAVQIAECVISG
ncbi:MAG: aspartate-semialdehyde dehydrogenase [Candidatus Omnitrophota bacterium]